MRTSRRTRRPRFVLLLLLLLPVSAAAATAAAGCPCADPAGCRPVDPARADAKRAARGGWELFAFTKRAANWTAGGFAWDNLTTVAYAGRGDPAQAAVCDAHAHDARVVLLSGAPPPPDAANRTRQVQELVARVVALGADGLNLDIERYAGKKATLTTYVTELAAALRSHVPSAQLSFDLGVSPNGQVAHYDHRALSQQLDFIVPMAYDENWGDLSPAPNSPLPALVESLAQYRALGVDPSKLVFALPWYGTSWPCASPVRGSPCKTDLGKRTWVQVVSQPAVSGIIARLGTQNTSAVRLEAVTQTKYFEWADNRTDPGSSRHVAAFDDADTIRAKVQSVASCRGVGMWYADCVSGEPMDEAAAMWSALGHPSI